MVDPFKLDYCPSRQVRLYSNLDSEYKQAMKIALKRIESLKPIIKLFNVES